MVGGDKTSELLRGNKRKLWYLYMKGALIKTQMPIWFTDRIRHEREYIYVYELCLSKRRLGEKESQSENNINTTSFYTQRRDM